LPPDVHAGFDEGLWVTPATLMVVLVVAALALANLVAAVAAWWAGRLRPAEVARTE
jgi:ABC-type lipoprotein release transport system permease subunit